MQYTKSYLEGLQFGRDLPTTELQYADDLAILAAHAYISLWTLTANEDYLLNCAILLEYASTKSKQSFQIRIILIRVYRLLGQARPLLKGINRLLAIHRCPISSYISLPPHECEANSVRYSLTLDSIPRFDILPHRDWGPDVFL